MTHMGKLMMEVKHQNTEKSKGQRARGGGGRLCDNKGLTPTPTPRLPSLFGTEEKQQQVAGQIFVFQAHLEKVFLA